MPMTHHAAASLTTLATLGQIEKYIKSNDSMITIECIYRNSSLIVAREVRRTSRASERKARPRSGVPVISVPKVSVGFLGESRG